MWGFLVGAVAGAAGYWAYQKFVVGNDDDAFADFETSSIDRPSASEVHGRPAEAVPGYSDPGASSSPSA